MEAADVKSAEVCDTNKWIRLKYKRASVKTRRKTDISYLRFETRLGGGGGERKQTLTALYSKGAFLRMCAGFLFLIRLVF